MYEKDTDELVEELKISSDIRDFHEQNKSEFKLPLHKYLHKLLAEKNLSKGELVEKINAGDKHIYHILSGIKKPSRKKLLTISRAMELNLEETNYLLRYGGFSALYVRDIWDSIIIRAIEKNLTILETNDILYKLGQPLLNVNPKDAKNIE